MSADNWSECPLCEHRYQELKWKEVRTVDDIEELKALKTALNECESTPVREDYEQGIDSKGLCYVIFSGVCSICGASWKFDKRDILPEDPEDIEKIKQLDV